MKLNVVAPENLKHNQHHGNVIKENYTEQEESHISMCMANVLVKGKLDLGAKKIAGTNAAEK